MKDYINEATTDSGVNISKSVAMLARKARFEIDKTSGELTK